MEKECTVHHKLIGGGELTIAAMDEYSRAEIGRKTYLFVRRVMQNPEMKRVIQARAAEIRAAAADQVSTIQERNT